MWLTSWWVAWLLNFYGFSHTNCMVFYLTLWARYGIPWNSMGTLWHSMELHRHFREPHGIPCNCTIFHGISWHSMELHLYFMELRGTPWHSMELHGYSMDTPLNSMDFHLFPWNSMDFHRFPWNCMEVFHTGLASFRNMHLKVFSSRDVSW